MRCLPVKSQFLRIFAFAVSVFSVNALTGVVAQTLSNQQNDRLERLERDIRALNLRMSRSKDGVSSFGAHSGLTDVNKPHSSSAIARLGVRIDRLEEDIRITTGTMEEVNYRITKIVDRLDKLVSDIDFRLSSLEAQVRVGSFNSVPGRSPTSDTLAENIGKLNANSLSSNTLGSVSVSEIEAVRKKKLMATIGQSNSPPISREYQSLDDPTSNNAPVGTPKDQYKHAFNLLQQANYDLAEVKLKAFIKLNEKNPLAKNARYWLGETYYVRKAYNDAAQVFFEGYQKSPNGPKAADSLLKLGMSLARLGKRQDACAAFSKLTMDFKKAPERIKRTLLRESNLNGCN